MDKTVPRGAAILLDFVRRTEVGTEGRDGYDVIYGFNQDELPKPITKMTVAEVQQAQPSWSRRFGSSATGAYQFMHATLGDLRKELGLRAAQIFDPDLQDRLAYHLLKRRGYELFMGGQISRTEFGDRLAMEWASFPVLRDRTGAHRQIKRGQSYYAGDGVNKALVGPEAFEAVLDAVKAAGSGAVQPPPPEPPEPAGPPVVTIGGVTLGAAAAAIVVAIAKALGWI